MCLCILQTSRALLLLAWIFDFVGLWFETWLSCWSDITICMALYILSKKSQLTNSHGKTRTAHSLNNHILNHFLKGTTQGRLAIINKCFSKTNLDISTWKFRAKPRPNTGAEFKYRLVINNKLVLLLADTGAMICVCVVRNKLQHGGSHIWCNPPMLRYIRTNQNQLEWRES